MYTQKQKLFRETYRNYEIVTYTHLIVKAKVEKLKGDQNIFLFQDYFYLFFTILMLVI